jgi:hypothetical protein
VPRDFAFAVVVAGVVFVVDFCAGGFRADFRAFTIESIAPISPKIPATIAQPPVNPAAVLSPASMLK